MLHSTVYDISLPKTYKKILYLHSAFNDTFVFLTLLSDRKHSLEHIDSKGKLLFSHIFDKPMDTMAMLHQKQVILLQTRYNKITVIDLQHKQLKYFPFQFMNEQTDQSSLYTFSKTKLLCIEQKGRYNDNRYKLTYLTYPLHISGKSVQTFVTFEAKDDQWNHQHKTCQGNHSSMILWYKPRHDLCFDFKTHSIEENLKGTLRVYKFSDPIAAEEKILKLEAVIWNVWQMKKDVFLFVCSTANQTKKDGTTVNSNYLIDISNNGKISQFPFTFGPYQNTLIDCLNFGPYSMFRTFRFQQSKRYKTIQTPVYYLDNQIFQLIAQESWQCSYEHKYQNEGYEIGMFTQGVYQNVDVGKIGVVVRRIVEKKEGEEEGNGGKEGEKEQGETKQ